MQYSASWYATSGLAMIYALHAGKPRCLWHVMVRDRANQGALPTASSRSARLFPSHCFLMSCCRLAYSCCIVMSRCLLPCRRGCFPVALSCCIVCAYAIVIGMIMVLGMPFGLTYIIFTSKKERYSVRIFCSLMIKQYLCNRFWRKASIIVTTVTGA